MQLIPIVERVTAELLPLAESGWGTRSGDRPLYRQEGDLVTHRTVGAQAYGRFLVDVFEEWARHDVGDVFVSMFDTALAHWMGMDQAGLCVHARTCGDAVALEHNGDLYSCDHYVEPGYLLGNIAEGRTMLELVNLPQQRAFGQAKLDTLPEYCRSCDVRFACNGGCPKDRFITHPRRRARAALPVRRLQGLLPPRRRTDAGHGRTVAPGARRHGAARLVRRTRRQAGGPTTRAPAAADAPSRSATAHPLR